jgi:DNA-binding transcriptional LysR family regulator
MTAWLLAPLVKDWREQRPHVCLEIEEFTSADRMTMHVATGGSDIAVGPRPTATAAHLELLGHERMVVVAACDHRFATK